MMTRDLVNSVATKGWQMSKERAPIAASVLKPGPYSFLRFSSAFYWLHLHSLKQFYAGFVCLKMIVIFTAMIYAAWLTQFFLIKILSVVMIIAIAPAFAAADVRINQIEG